MDPETQAIFQAEAQGLVESLEAGLLALRDCPTDREVIDRVFRDLHTLKGTGGMFGEVRLAAFVHGFETLFEEVRSGRRAATPALIALSLRAHDHIAALLEDPEAPGSEAILGDLGALLGGNQVSTAGPQAETDTPVWRLTFRLPADTLVLGGRPEVLLDEMRALGATRVRCKLSDLPPPNELTGGDLCLAWTAELPGAVSEEAIRDVFLFHDGVDLSLDRDGGAPPSANVEVPVKAPVQVGASAVLLADGATPPPARPPAAPPRDASPAARPNALMRVSAERLDEMMDRVGELLIAQARLAALVAELDQPAFLAVAEDIQRLAAGMRDTTMSIRMTPLGSITGRFRRLVHDLAANLDKPIDLVIEGEDTELDKTVVEQLADPLLHLIRNAADHGLEVPAQRAKVGKLPAGRITLAARHAGAEVLIALTDDGRGLDPDRIRAKAVERGLLAPDANLPPSELFQLVFQPGFSTASQVTELSGRGVGMDVVKRTVLQLRGSIDLASELGRGTTVTLRLPLTLAIIDALHVEVAGERFAIPLSAVDEIVELPEGSSGQGGSRLLDIRGRLVPYLPLRAVLDSPGEPGAFQKVVVVSAGDARVGLAVDRIIASTQTVIKQLSPLHAGLTIFSGATILGDGTVALILDVAALVAQARDGAGSDRSLVEKAA